VTSWHCVKLRCTHLTQSDRDIGSFRGLSTSKRKLDSSYAFVSWNCLQFKSSKSRSSNQLLPWVKHFFQTSWKRVLKISRVNYEITTFNYYWTTWKVGSRPLLQKIWLRKGQAAYHHPPKAKTNLAIQVYSVPKTRVISAWASQIHTIHAVEVITQRGLW
jgi:hypothetical protein